MYQRNLFLFVALLCLGSVMATAQAEGQAKTAVCVACHGADGNSMNPIWPNLAGQHAEYTEAQLLAFRSGARANNAQMTGVAAKMNDAEIKAVADYIAGLR